MKQQDVKLIEKPWIRNLISFSTGIVAFILIGGRIVIEVRQISPSLLKPWEDNPRINDGAVDSQAEAESSALADAISKLQKDNEELQARLAESDAKLAKLTATGPADAQVAADARIKKLELQLARLQSELDSAKQSSVEGSGLDWLTLIGGGLVILLLGGGA